MHGFILTRLEHLETAGLVRRNDLRKSVRRTRQALDAQTPAESPDHAIRLKAADQFFRLADLYPKRDAEPLDPGRPLQVNIILAGGNGAGAGAALQSHGVRLHLDSGERENGHT